MGSMQLILIRIYVQFRSRPVEGAMLIASAVGAMLASQVPALACCTLQALRLLSLQDGYAIPCMTTLVRSQVEELSCHWSVLICGLERVRGILWRYSGVEMPTHHVFVVNAPDTARLSAR